MSFRYCRPGERPGRIRPAGRGDSGESRRTAMKKAFVMTLSAMAATIVIPIAGAAVPGVLLAQGAQAPASAPKADTPAVTRHIDAARKAAGTEWPHAVPFICNADQNDPKN